ncbi:MAG TPA: shikimate dehydrogenase [Steroidobacteraceae bacterium]|nr:shikimate dehydrogenase [Steroidobacteraceae bacterium]
MSGTVDSYGVVGHPVAHSLSPFIHAMFARQTGQAMSYRLFDFAPEAVQESIATFFAGGGCGLNITLPYKIAAVARATELTQRAHHAGAVNTLAMRKDGTILGDNTDGVGLTQDLCVNQRVVVTRRRVLIIGAGGAVRGVLAPLLGLEPELVVIANRTADRAKALATAFASLGPVEGAGFRYIAGGAFDLVINATSASLTGEIPDVPVGVIGADTFCYDMAYGKGDTPFVRWCVELGCRAAVPGWGMLVEQAAESFRLWRGVRPLTAPVLSALTAS